MTMRSTRELLVIMLQEIWRLRTGLCGLIWRLYDARIFDNEEYHRMKNYIKDHRPFNFCYIMMLPFYWESGASKPRRRWLKKHINLLK
jgi:hypothetical protein